LCPNKARTSQTESGREFEPLWGRSFSFGHLSYFIINIASETLAISTGLPGGNCGAMLGMM
jgi:hypothetical protein